MNKLKSINVNEIVDKKNVKENLDRPLVRVKGFAVSQFSHITKYGENVGFKGGFVAVNLLTGEVFESEAAFLPKGITAEISRKLDNAENHEVEFTCEIRATASDKNSQGYAWVTDAPQTKEQMNRYEQMKLEAAEFAKGIAALPAPKKGKAA